MKRLTAAIIVTFLMVILSSTAALAIGEIAIGGKTTATIVANVTSTNPDIGDSTDTLVVGSTLGYVTPTARFEYAVGLFIVADFDGVFQTYSPVAEARVNTNLLGSEENILFYVGGIVGMSIIAFGDFDTEYNTTYGGKAGAEYYFSPNVAMQLEDRLQWDDDDNRVIRSC